MSKQAAYRRALTSSLKALEQAQALAFTRYTTSVTAQEITDALTDHESLSGTLRQVRALLRRHDDRTDDRTDDHK